MFRQGRFPFSRVSSNNIELPQAPPEATDVLTKVADAQDAGRALDQFSPPHEAYQKLKAALAEMRGKSHAGRKEIGDGPLLKLVGGTFRWKMPACRCCASASGSLASLQTSSMTPSSSRR